MTGLTPVQTEVLTAVRKNSRFTARDVQVTVSTKRGRPVTIGQIRGHILALVEKGRVQVLVRGDKGQQGEYKRVA
jgi:hypothetical protein